MERDPVKLNLLEKWKETLQSRHTVATFQDGARLAVQVTTDLARMIEGFENSATEDTAAILKEAAAAKSELARIRRHLSARILSQEQMKITRDHAMGADWIDKDRLGGE